MSRLRFGIGCHQQREAADVDDEKPPDLRAQRTAVPLTLEPGDAPVMFVMIRIRVPPALYDVLSPIDDPKLKTARQALGFVLHSLRAMRRDRASSLGAAGALPAFHN
jgi:hypothetical protein